MSNHSNAMTSLHETILGPLPKLLGDDLRRVIVWASTSMQLAGKDKHQRMHGWGAFCPRLTGRKNLIERLAWSLVRTDARKNAEMHGRGPEAGSSCLFAHFRFFSSSDEDMFELLRYPPRLGHVRNRIEILQTDLKWLPNFSRLASKF